MKRILISCFAIALLASCATTEKMLMRQWKVVDVQIVDSLGSLTPTQLEALTRTMKQDLVFNVGPDSAYHVAIGKNTVAGKWWLSPDKKTFYTTDGKEVVPGKMISLSKTGFEYEMDATGGLKIHLTCNAIANGK
jgi:hypothetical protein